MKILLIEDDESLADLVVEKLTEQKQYLVEWSSDGDEGLELAESYEYDIILLDVALPKLNGIQVCQQLRERGNSSPILLLTARDSISQKVAGLDAGADDYLVKPFDLRELFARIRALSRRSNDILQSVLQWENLTLDPNNCQVNYQQNPLKLTAKEYSLLELFLRHPQRIFNQNSLIDKVWSWEESPSENAVRTQIKSLRHKLKAAGLQQDLIETVYGLGYRLKKAPSNKIVRADSASIGNNFLTLDNPKINLIWQKYQDNYRDRITILQQATKAMRDQHLDPSLKQEAVTIAHTLTGSLGSFGYSESSQICAEIETLLQHSDRKTSLRLEELLERLLIQLDTPATQSSFSLEGLDLTLGSDERVVSYGNSIPPYKLLIVDDDVPLTEALVSEALAWGIEADVARTLDAARLAIAKNVPDAILLDLSFPNSQNGGLKLLEELSNRPVKIPVIAFTAKESFANRIEVARLGGKGFLTKPVSPARAVETVAAILEQASIPEAKILLVDSHQGRLEAIAKILRPWQWEIVSLTDIQKFWEVLETTNPDLIVTRLEMDRISGVELCQIVRHDPRWSHLPIIVLTAREDTKTIQRICAVGADDYLSFPPVEEELLACILNRLDKERHRRYLAETDPLTGIPNRRASLKELTRLLRVASRQHKSWCFVAIDLDNFKQINDIFGHDSGDRVLRRFGQLLKREFRHEDAIARWGGEEFILGLYDMTKQSARERLTDFLTLFGRQKFVDSQDNSFRVTFSAGIAEYPLDGVVLETLYQFADKALYRAKAAGKNCII